MQSVPSRNYEGAMRGSGDAEVAASIAARLRFVPTLGVGVGSIRSISTAVLGFRAL